MVHKGRGECARLPRAVQLRSAAAGNSNLNEIFDERKLALNQRQLQIFIRKAEFIEQNVEYTPYAQLHVAQRLARAVLGSRKGSRNLGSTYTPTPLPRITQERTSVTG